MFSRPTLLFFSAIGKRVKKFKNRKLLAFFPLLIFVTFSIFYVYQSRQRPIVYWDEADWVGTSYFFELFKKADWDSVLWASYFGYDQPKLTQYLFGAAIYPKYLKSQKARKQDYIAFLLDHNLYRVDGESYYHLYKENKTDFIDWSREEDTYHQVDYLIAKYGPSFQKTIDLIMRARLVSALALAGAVLVNYLIALRLSNQKIALLTIFLRGFNSLIMRVGLLAQSDGLFLLIFNLGIFFYSEALLMMNPALPILCFSQFLPVS